MMVSGIGLLSLLVVAGLGLLFVVFMIVGCVRLLFRRQDRVLLSRTEAEQLARLDRGFERMEERIENMETILLNRDPADAELETNGVGR
jgi:phage shock protein B